MSPLALAAFSGWALMVMIILLWSEVIAVLALMLMAGILAAMLLIQWAAGGVSRLLAIWKRAMGTA